MRIALISPKAAFLSRDPRFNEFWSLSGFTASYRQNWSGISPGLLVLASLTPSSYNIDIIDENIEDIDFSKNYDLVGISSMTQQAIRAYQIGDEFKRRNIKVIIGGIHATVLPNEAKAHADSVAIGEAEYIWPQLLKDFEKSTLKPFYNNKRTIDLRDSPVPKYELVRFKGYKTIWIQTTRGCPHDCEFCAASNVYGSKLRSKTTEQVIKEIEAIKEICGDVRINFGDDNLLVNKKLSNDLLNKLIPMKIRWAAESDISIAKNDEILDLMRRSGCALLFIGLESISEEGLKNLDKHGWKLKHFSNYSSYIRKIQSYGISVMGSFILGLDCDDSLVIKKIIDFANDNNLGDIQVSILTPLPGTRLRIRLEKENRLLNTNWDNYTFFDVNFIHPKLSRQELEDGLLEIYKSINSKDAFYKKMQYFKEIQKKLLKKA